MATNERHAWDQQAGEPDSAYARFLTYRALGPTRSVSRAADIHAVKTGSNAGEGGRDRQISGTWQRDCARWKWVSRADAWDIWSLLNLGNKVCENYLRVIAAFAESAVLALKDPALTRPSSMEEALKILDMLSKVISKEAMDAFFARLKFDLESTTEAVGEPVG